ncbi:MAG: hypothetical protein NTX11_00520, partial [Candidatus Saccharibacteria bacterium]|nr:hypothetical protein [Candidatus Saccharibacteria bacterium]
MTQQVFADGPPTVTITSSPTNPSSQTTPIFEFSADQESTFFCSVDGGLSSACTSPYNTSALTGGSHTFAVFARNLSGETGPTDTYSWTIDLTAPNTILDIGPTAITVNPVATFEFSSEPSTTFECSVDNDNYATCTSPYATSDLPLGVHSFGVRAIDSAGNVDQTPAIASWTVVDESAGDGTPERPFKVRVCDDLSGINFAITASYEMANDIDCSESTVVPIGNANVPFTGTFNGNGYTISNIDLYNDGYLGTGLFGAASGATISGVRLVDSSFVEGEANGQYSMGALVGVATNTTMSDITSSNLSVSTADSSSNYLGGLVGYMEGTSVLENSHFDGTISNGSNSQNGTGGLVGFSIGTSNVLQSDVRNSYA